jgi:hypothetical protein
MAMQNIINRLKIIKNMAKEYSVPDTLKNSIDELLIYISEKLDTASDSIKGRVNTPETIYDKMSHCRVGDNFGNEVNPFDLNPEDYSPHLFAQNLSREFRFYNCMELSVAEHCINMTEIAETLDEKKWALMHENWEAYMKDLPTPVKRMLPEYKASELRELGKMAEYYGLPKEMPYNIHLIDKQMMISEAVKYMGNPDKWIKIGHDMGMEEFGFPIEPVFIDMLRDTPMSPKEAQLEFAKTWKYYGFESSVELDNFIFENNKDIYDELDGLFFENSDDVVYFLHKNCVDFDSTFDYASDYIHIYEHRAYSVGEEMLPDSISAVIDNEIVHNHNENLQNKCR